MTMQIRVLPRRIVCALLALAPCMHTVTAQSLGTDFISLPAEFASRVPVRLVYTQSELVQCWKDGTARRCVLRADMKLQAGAWQQAFSSTGGTAAVPAEGGIFTISSGGLQLLCHTNFISLSRYLPVAEQQAWRKHSTRQQLCTPTTVHWRHASR
jgi:hypothetical protein